MKKFAKFIILAIIAIAAVQFTSCQSCQREIKSIGSDWGGGLNRTLTVFDYNGDTIVTYEGKFDIRDDSSDNKIFFDIDGKRVWIQGGIVVSEEKGVIRN